VEFAQAIGLTEGLGGPGRKSSAVLPCFAGSDVMDGPVRTQA
jgi:hypothetical protein